MTRSRLRLAVLAFATLLLAQTQPQSTTGGETLQLSPTAGLTAKVEKHPLQSLPYTPSLDLNSMDRTADACVDFYQYVCGGWMKNNPIPPDQASWSVYAKLANENEQFLWGILEEASDPGRARSASEQKIGDYFQACMDEPAIEKLGGAPLEAGLGEIGALKSKAELAKYLGQEHLAVRGSGTLFGFGSNQDFADATQVIAFARAGGLGLPDRDYYTKTDTKSQQLREQYVGHVQRMFVLMGAPAGAAAGEAKTVMAMEAALAQKSLTRVQKRDPYNQFHKMDRAKLKALTPDFDWDTYLTAHGLASVGTFNVTEPEFYREVDRLIQSESLDDWKTYLRWHLAHAWAPFLSMNFQQENFDFYSHTLRGVAVMEPRWKRCVRLVDRDLGEALGQVFVAKTFGPDVKARTVKMTREIEAAMEDDLKDLPWMGPETKQQALAKLHTIVNKIGYPDKWRDYSSLEIVRGDFAGNVRRSAIFESRRELAKIGKPVDRGEWGMTPPTVNAYYDSQMNDINFPAGVLQPPLFDPKMDDAPNYGNTGGTIGHELTHGFDDEGRKFDAKGNLRDWWTKDDASQFDERIACVREQYAQYIVVDDIHINSKLTSGEDVADLGGTLLAYIAWKNATKGQDLKPIDGFTPDQRFFIGYAQWACENDRPEDLRVHAMTDPHSPGKYRVNGIVSDLPQFQQAFGCKPGQPMVRPKMCRVW
ncbi:MAG TPA: M13 family metallopeptidase [Terriglobia bacterium]|nr:M13 family metallopeptidase [Terriglobia bacterium]